MCVVLFVTLLNMFNIYKHKKNNTRAHAVSAKWKYTSILYTTTTSHLIRRRTQCMMVLLIIIIIMITFYVYDGGSM